MFLCLGSALAQAERPDFTAWKGRYRGAAQVTYGDVFDGRAKIQCSVPGAGRRMIVRIKGSVVSNGTRIPIDNQWKLKTSGKLLGKELAPGVTAGRTFKTPYEAAAGSLSFGSTINLGSSTGRITGTMTRDASTRQVSIVFAIYVGDATQPTYQFTASAAPLDS